MVAALTYAFAVNFIPAYREPADKIGESSIGLVEDKKDEEAANQPVEERDDAISAVKETARADADISHIEKKDETGI